MKLDIFHDFSIYLRSFNIGGNVAFTLLAPEFKVILEII